MNHKEVSVVIPAFNAKATIGRAIISALAQKYVQEVIVCDDGSQDETSETARRHDDGTGRLSVLSIAENAGPAAARNIALEAARSPYVCLLDSDDFFLPNRIARLLDADVGEWDMLADDIVIAPETLDPANISFQDLEQPCQSSLLDLASFVTANISRPARPRHEWGFLKPLMKRAFLDQHHLRYDETLRLAEDYAFYVCALIAGARFRLVSAGGYIAIERNTSISSSHSANDLKKIVDFDAIYMNEQKLTSSERAAFAAHRQATQRKCDYSTVLEINKERGLLPALLALSRMSSSWSYITTETLKAKTVALTSLLGSQRENTTKLRSLIGVPQGTTIKHDASYLAEPTIHATADRTRD